MAVRKDTIFERFLAPFFKTFLIDQEALVAYHKSINWEQESDRLRNLTLTYPDYYRSKNFHGIEGGYLNVSAATTYDPITQHVLPPSEEWVRRELIQRVQSKPQRILDLGCGTGSMTVMLKQAFPDAEVIGVDLSPYMLVAATHKATKAGYTIQFLHNNAEHLGFPDRSVDLVTAALLFHETPTAVSCTILKEAFRVLRVGGEMLVLDGNQGVLHQTDWLTEIFEEPYIKDYAAGNLNDWMAAAGFGAIQTDAVWLIHQVTRGVKPLPGRSPAWRSYEELEQGQWAVG